ncbi:c9969007-cbde-484f-a738-ebec87723f9e [Sclerotinia trifoliorum]|uniref:C9969007-cbde-484f-a738-ebec87723f9e n=1 Tax=Sclerotinia trifoliorum TaxID=28548 RepID=A0A8H2ZM63_9HELO|nr:c9969007-cbde-484f-a738-ebec87723f9e [Sclerotinia trifoliorum]
MADEKHVVTLRLPAQALLRIGAELVSAHLGVLTPSRLLYPEALFAITNSVTKSHLIWSISSQGDLFNGFQASSPRAYNLSSLPGKEGHQLKVNFGAFYHITLRHPSDMIWLRIIRVCGKKLHRRLSNTTFKIRSSIQWS